MSTTNSNGDLILIIDANTQKAVTSIKDLVKQIKTAMDSLSNDRTKSPVLINLETQAQKSIQRIEQLQRKIRDLQYGPELSPQFKELDSKAKQVEKRIDELKAKIREMSAQEIPTEKYTALQERLNQLKSAYDNLKEKQKQYAQGSEEYNRIARGLQNIKSVAWGVRNQMNELIRSGQAFEANLTAPTKEFERANIELQKEEQHLFNIQNKISTITDHDSKGWTQEYQKANEQLQTEQINLSGIQAKIQSINSNAETSTGRVSQFFRNMANNVSRSYERVKKSSKSAARATENVFNKVTGNLKVGLKTLIKYGLGMRSFFFLFRRVRSAVIESYKELAKYSTDVNKVLSDTKSAATKLKNSIAVAIQPLVQVMAPVITTMAKNLADAFNHLAQFFAALTGQSYVFQAIDVQEDFAKSLDDTATNADKATKALDKYLSPLDDLNRYTSDKGKDEEASDLSPAKFTTVEVDSKFKDIAAKVKSYFKDIFKPIKNAWNTYGQRVMDSWYRLLSNIRGVIKDIGIAFRNVWLNGTGERTVGNILILWKDILDIVNAVIETFRKAWNKDSLGEQVLQAFFDNFNGLLELIHTVAKDFKEVFEDGTGETIWANILKIVRNINTTFSKIWENIKNAWEEGDTGKKIWENILGLVSDISEFFSDITETLVKWASELDFNPLLESVEDITAAFRYLWDVLSKKLKGVFEQVLLPLAKWTIEKGVPKIIKLLAGALKIFGSIIEKIPQPVINGIAAGILAIVVAFKVGKIVYSIAKSIASGIALIASHPAIAIIAGITMAIVALITAMKNYNNTNIDPDKLNDAIKAAEDYATKLSDASTALDTIVKQSETDIIEMKVNFKNIDEFKERLQDIISDGFISQTELPEFNRIIDTLKSEVDGFEEYWDNNIVFDEKTGKITVTPPMAEFKDNLDTIVDNWKVASAKIRYQNILTALQTAKAQNIISEKTTTSKISAAERAIQSLIESNDNFYAILYDYAYVKDGQIDYDRLFKKIRSSPSFVQSILSSEVAGMQDTFSDQEKELFTNLTTSYISLTAEAEGYSTAQRQISYEIRNTDSAINSLYGATTNYSTAIKLVTDGIWSEQQAVENFSTLGIKSFKDLKTAAWVESNATSNALGLTIEAVKKAPDTFATVLPRILTILKLFVGDMGSELDILKQKGSDAGKGLMTKLGDALTGSDYIVRDSLSTVINNIDAIFSASKLGGLIGGVSNIFISALPNIPHLASGAVIPAGKPFMAMLGDQKTGTNLEAPEGLIRKIIKEEIGNKPTGNNTYTIPVQIGRKTLFTLVLDEAKLQQSQMGYNPFVKMGG